MSIRLCLVAVVLVLASCAYKPAFNTDIVEVDKEQLDKYWLPESPSVQFNFDGLTPEQVAAGGYADIEYVIDSNGRVTHARVIDASSPVWGVAARRAVAEGRYVPAPGNDARVPVMVGTDVTFKPAPLQDE